MTMRALIAVAAALTSLTSASAETLHCSKSFQGYRICDDGHGHRCAKWEHDPAEDLVARPPVTDPPCPTMPQEENK